jgi:hypothetical protein
MADPKPVSTAEIARQSQPPARAPAPPSSPAESVFRRLVMYIRDFEAQLDPNQEIGGRMVSFGPMLQFHILDIGYWGPDIITFDGLDEGGHHVKLIQNISQLNVLLVAMPQRKPQEEAHRIGFLLEAKGAAKLPAESDHA